MATVRLADYRPAPFTIEHTQLLFQLHADHTVVDAAFQLVPAGAAEAAPWEFLGEQLELLSICLLYTSPSPRDKRQSRMPSSA